MRRPTLIGVSSDCSRSAALVAPIGHPFRHLGAIVLASRARLRALAERRGEVLQRQPGVAASATSARVVRPISSGADIDVDQRLAGRDQLEALGRDLAELAADDDQRVGGGDELVGDARIAAEQSGGQRMRAGDRALARHRVRDRDAVALRQREQRVISLRDVDAAADQQQRPLGLGDERGRALERRPRRGACGAPAL